MNGGAWMVWKLWPNVIFFSMFTGAWNVRSSVRLNISHDRAHQYASSYQEWMMSVEWFGSYDQMSFFFQCSLEREMFGQAWNWTSPMIELINMHHPTKHEWWCLNGLEAVTKCKKKNQCSLEREMFGQAWNWTSPMIELINMHHPTKNEWWRLNGLKAMTKCKKKNQRRVRDYLATVLIIHSW